ncbi:FAD-binding oxidoreductase [Aerosakkonemataceae cyanobacterium BLCC-F50]|uniref:FAD-binding oxidoreductase n=1 Tax=Floridaenema flaviceps BLCC-F50 TaxID=3153642 RepID=A0ABV4XV58_9CYAN
MLSQVSEKTMHSVRWVLVIGWLILIASLFYDPISPYLTDPNNLTSPFQDPIRCVLVQGKCLDVKASYQMGTRIFWGMVIPCAIAIVLVFGHETWRRICPLYFLSQIPRALNLQPILNIEKNRWLTNNHLYIQFGFFFIGLNARILFVNSARPVLGLFLILTISLAIAMVFLYDGRSWCHYVCPFNIVQMVFTGPRGLLGSEAHKAPAKSITQSMCRTIDETTGQEKSACINCKSPCLDIDAERTYWDSLTQPGRKLIQYGYLGLVTSYFIYYFLYSGNFDYYYSGVWTHETDQLASLFTPGFYIYDRAIPIPKIIAAPITLAFGVFISYVICRKLEKIYKAYLRKKNPNITQSEVLHRVFSICTFVSFNIFFIYGGRPEILRFPTPVQLAFNALVILVSTLWLYRTWGRSAEKYTRESLADKLRHQLKKMTLDFSEFLEGRSLDNLKPDEVYVLAKVLPNATQQEKLQVYKGVLEEALEAGNTNASSSLEILQDLRQKLSISESEHYTILTELGIENPDLLDPNQKRNREHQLRISNYCHALNLLLLELVESGISLEQAFQKKSKQIRALKQKYRITSEEAENILAALTANFSASPSQYMPLATLNPTSINRWTEGNLSVRCVQTINETKDVKSFRFVAEPPVLFTYQPGQFITLDLQINGQQVMRSYSISSPPSRPHILEITVKRLPEGLVSNWLHDNLQMGSEIKLNGPMGKFTCFANPSQKLLLISAGSGITPMISMSRWICDTASDVDVFFIYSARTPGDIIFREELELMAATYPNFKLAITITQLEAGKVWSGYRGRLNEFMLTSVAPDFRERTVYVCGPDNFMQAVKTMLEKLDFPMQNYYQESFGSSNKEKKLPKNTPSEVTSTKVKTNQSSSSKLQPNVSKPKPITNENDAAPSSKEPSSTSTPSQATVVFAKSGKEIVCDGEESILELAEQEDISLNSGCRMGVCGACKQKLISGEVNYEKEPDGLQKSDRSVDVLTCIAYPIAKVVIDA